MLQECKDFANSYKLVVLENASYDNAKNKWLVSTFESGSKTKEMYWQ